MVLVRERDRLRAYDPLLRLIRRLHENVAQAHKAEREPEGAEDCQARQGVCAGVKNLWHWRCPPVSAMTLTPCVRKYDTTFPAAAL
jgi:hypothetical protein